MKQRYCTRSTERMIFKIWFISCSWSWLESILLSSQTLSHTPALQNWQSIHCELLIKTLLMPIVPSSERSYLIVQRKPHIDTVLDFILLSKIICCFQHKLELSWYSFFFLNEINSDQKCFTSINLMHSLWKKVFFFILFQT